MYRFLFFTCSTLLSFFFSLFFFLFFFFFNKTALSFDDPSINKYINNKIGTYCSEPDHCEDINTKERIALTESECLARRNTTWLTMRFRTRGSYLSLLTENSLLYKTNPGKVRLVHDANDPNDANCIVPDSTWSWSRGCKKGQRLNDLSE